MENSNEKVMTPSQYFDFLKGAKQRLTTNTIKDSYDVFLHLGEKYSKLGQKESLKKLCFLADTLIKEEKLLELGIDTYIYKDLIEDYIEHIADKTIKIVELSRYMREIPDEFVDTVEKTKDLFDEFYVLFTDYTGKEERKVAKERRDKDPILFGTFKNDRNIADRFYFLGDWIDEYCDLTLDKMINEYKSKKGFSPAIEINVPQTSEELVSILKTYKIDGKDSDYQIELSNQYSDPLPAFKATNESQNNTKSFFGKIYSVIKNKFHANTSN